MLRAGGLRLKERGNGSFNRRLPDSFRADSNPCHLPTLRIRFSAAAGKSGGLPSQNAPAAFLESRARLVGHLPPSAIFCRPASVRTRPPKMITSNYRNLESRVGPSISIVCWRQGLPAGPALRRAF
jgi:hypothetical protein